MPVEGRRHSSSRKMFNVMGDPNLAKVRAHQVIRSTAQCFPYFSCLHAGLVLLPCTFDW